MAYIPNLANGIAQGGMAFWDATLYKWTYTETSELFWNDTNKRLSINTTINDTNLNIGGATGIYQTLDSSLGGLRIVNPTNSLAMYVAIASNKGYINVSSTGNSDLILNSGTGKIGVGTTTPNAKTEILSATEQLRLSYSASIFASQTVDGSGWLTLNSTGGKTILKMNSGQTSNLLELQDSAGNVLNGLYVNKDRRLLGNGGIFTRNSYFAMSGQGVNDMSMTGWYDRNELVNCAYSGNITITITGSGTFTDTLANKNFLVNGSADFMSITGTDNTTTKIEILLDNGSNVSNYGSANWQPFLQYRSEGLSTRYNKITAEVSVDGITWYTATGWSTTDALTTVVPALWIGTNNTPITPGNTWRYAKFTLEDRVENAGYAFKDFVWISQIGMRHYSAPMAKQYPILVGNNAYYGTQDIYSVIDPTQKTQIYTDSSGNTIITPSGGDVDVNGVIQTDGYNSADGTTGATANVDVAKVGGGTRTLHFKNGLYTGFTDS